MSQVEMVRPRDMGVADEAIHAFYTPAVARLIARRQHRRRAHAHRRADRRRQLRRPRPRRRTLEMVRDQFRRFADDKVIPHAHGWHERDELIPMAIIEEMAELGVFGLTIPEEYGGLGMGKIGDVRRHRGAVARLHRRRLARHPLGDRRRADPPRRHRRAEGALAAEAGLGARSCRPRSSPSPNTGSDLGSLRTRAVQGRRRLQGHRQQDLDHPRRPHRPDDAAGAHRPGAARTGRACRCSSPRSRAAPTPSPFPAEGHDRRRDRGAGLSRHEGIRDRLRRLRGAGENLLGGQRGPGLQAADGDLRERAHPDRGARRRRRAERAWSWA